MPSNTSYQPNDGPGLDKSKIDYSLYLVTGRELLPDGVDYYESLEASVKDGGVTVVQLREKNTDAGEFLEIAKRSLAICDKYNIPMLINDNLSLALMLPKRVGVHLGQDDVPIPMARQLLGPERLLGISCHSVEHARAARTQGADYAGVGPCWGTQSKAGVTEDKVLGPRGARAVVEALADGHADAHNGPRIPCVLIGGLNARTALRTLFGATSETNSPDGIAVISAIVASRDPAGAGRGLANIVRRFKSGLAASRGNSLSHGTAAAFGSSSQLADGKSYVQAASTLLTYHRSSSSGPPLIQTMTSHVSSTLSANIALAYSASPIMSHQPAEAEDLGKVIGALVLNIGTISPEAQEGMRVAGRAANANGKPVVVDPVGVGATTFRKNVVSEILNHTQITLLKGNAAELGAIFGSSEVAARGVDSAGDLKDPARLVRDLARKERCLVLLTGKTDYLSDGQRVLSSSNGHELLGRITGSGCALGVVVAAGLAACSSNGQAGSVTSARSLGDELVKEGADLLVGALMGLLSLTIASEIAAARNDVRGPGTFIPALIDELAALSPDVLLERAKVEYVNVM